MFVFPRFLLCVLLPPTPAFFPPKDGADTPLNQSEVKKKRMWNNTWIWKKLYLKGNFLQLHETQLYSQNWRVWRLSGDISSEASIHLSLLSAQNKLGKHLCCGWGGTAEATAKSAPNLAEMKTTSSTVCSQHSEQKTDRRYHWSIKSNHESVFRAHELYTHAHSYLSAL